MEGIFFFFLCFSCTLLQSATLCPFLASLFLSFTFPPSVCPSSCLLPSHLSPSLCLDLSSIRLPPRLSLSLRPPVCLSGLQGVRLANMDARGGETKCSSQHKAGLILCRLPPQHSLITESWLVGIKTDRQADRQADRWTGRSTALKPGQYLAG